MRRGFFDLLNSFLLAPLLMASCVERAPVPREVSSSLSGQPTWLPLGPDVYHTSTHVEAEKQVLALRLEPRWFLGYSKLGDERERDEYLSQVNEQLAGAKYTPEVVRAIDGRFVIPTVPPYPKRL